MYQNYQQPQQQIAPIFNPGSVNVGINNLPQIPQLQLKWQEMQQFVALIAVFVANLAARHALNNPARTIVFNKIFENNLANQYFYMAILTTADLVGMGFVKNQINTSNLNQAIEQNAENVLAALTAMTIVNDPMISSSTNYETMNVAKNSLALFQRQVDEIKYFGTQYQQPVQSQWGAPNQGGYQNNNYPGGNFGGIQQPDVYTNRNFGATPPQSNFQSYPTAERSFPSTPPMQGVVGQWTSSPPVDKPQFIKMSDESPVENTEPVVQKEKPLVWAPSDLQPHRLAFDPLLKRSKLITRVLDGKVIVVEQLEDLTEEEMQENWEKHKLELSPPLAEIRKHVEVDMYRIPTVQDVKSSPIEPTHRSQVIDNIKGLNRAELNDDFLVRAGISRKPFEDKEDGKLVWKEASFVSDALLSVKIHHTQMKDSKTTMRRERFVVPKVFVCKHDVKRVIEAAFKEKNFLITAMKLKEFLLKEGTTIEQKEMISELDRYLAALINIFICDYLSITNIWIDSFIGDVPTLFEGYIEKECGFLVFEKFKENQYRIYNSYLKICENEELINIVASQYGRISEEQYDEENGDICFLIFEQYYTVTSVRLTSDEIKLDSTVTPTSKIIDGLYPAMIEYCRNLFEDQETFNENWAGHLLITSNNKLYNFMESPIMRKAYLAKEFNLIHLLP